MACDSRTERELMIFGTGTERVIEAAKLQKQVSPQTQIGRAQHRRFDAPVGVMRKGARLAKTSLNVDPEAAEGRPRKRGDRARGRLRDSGDQRVAVGVARREMLDEMRRLHQDVVVAEQEQI